ncbi:UNVERIFIED_ORG: hypothetical protein ABID33_003861 [Xanthobacter viscosus]|uniref:excisionase n=1 Tax=Xanthobacter autotrophicus TaxID=280 RepID=UPI001FE49668|nr:excisionase [Xanthobacter autotrophicus]
MTKRIPRLDEVTDTMPLRLTVAAALAFPDGSMGASGLRREAARGRLAVERIAGKDYTTLRAIEEMREQCRVQPKAPACGSAQPGATRRESSRTQRHGSSSTVDDSIPLASALMIARGLKERSPTTKRRS